MSERVAGQEIDIAETREYQSVQYAFDKGWRRADVEMHYLRPRNSKGGTLCAQKGLNHDRMQESVARIYANGEPQKAPSYTVDAESIRGTLVNILTDSRLKTIEKHKACAKAVTEHLLRRGRFYYDQRSREHSTAMYFDRERHLLLRVRSDEFLSWLALHLEINRAEQTFKYIKAAVEDESLAGDTQSIIPDEYFTMRQDKIYLSNGDGRMVRILKDRFELVENGTDSVLFAAGCTLDPWTLTEPRNPFEECRAFNNISTGEHDNHARDLFMAWALSLPTVQRCKPPLVVTGPVGSGKTRLVVSLLELYGMQPRILTPSKYGEDDFWTSVNIGGVLCLDNVDVRHDWLPDALSMAATGGSKEKRKLYSDNDRVIQMARSWIAVTSANPTFASDAGLADRVIVVRLQRRTGETAEHELSDEVKDCRDAGLSWICNVLKDALCDPGDVPPGLNSRHPDFAAFAIRIGRAIGHGEAMIRVLTRAEIDKHLLNLENSAVGEALLSMITQGNSFHGTAGELLEELKAYNSDFGIQQRWNSRKLGRFLSKIWPHLDVIFQADMTTHGGQKAYKLSVKSEQHDVREATQERPKTDKCNSSSAADDTSITDFVNEMNARNAE